MPLIMFLYYAICLYLIAVVVWNFIREKNADNMILYLLVLIPLILRIFRIK